MDLLFLIVGIVLFVVGILFFSKNSRITKGIMDKLQNITKLKIFGSKYLGAYTRLRFYLAGIIFIFFGLIFMIGSL